MSANRLRPAERPVIPSGTPATNGHGSLPIILATGRPLREVTADALRAVVEGNNPPAVFQRGGQLVRIRRDECEQPLIERLGPDALRGVLERRAQFLMMDRDGALRPIAPPEVVVKDLAALPDWPGIPSLAGVSDIPIVHEDGSIFTTPGGYDEQTQTIYLPGPDVPEVPENPTAADVTEAVKRLEALHEGFSFGGPADRASALGEFLTLVLRDAIPGRVPGFVHDAPIAASGKSALARLHARIAVGEPGAFPEVQDPNEERKRLHALLLAGHRVLIDDDVSRRIESPVLAAFITLPVWTDRTLGASAVVSIPNHAVVVLCGNNLAIGRDLWRRLVWVRLDPRMADPSRRTFSRDLEAWAAENRGSVVWAACTIYRAWHLAGRPAAPVPVFAGFNSWASIIGSILHFIKVEGFLSNLSAVRAQADEGEAEVEQFLRAWHQVYSDASMRVAQVASDIATGPGDLRDALPSYLVEFADDRGQRRLAHKLGNLLRRRVDRRYGTDGVRVERAGEDRHQKVGMWRVVTDPPAPGGVPEVEPPTEGSVSDPTVTSSLSVASTPTQTPIGREDLPEITLHLAGPPDDGQRTYVLALARSFDWPRLPFAPGRSVAAGPEAWSAFVTHAPDEDTALVVVALQARDGKRR